MTESGIGEREIWQCNAAGFEDGSRSDELRKADGP